MAIPIGILLPRSTEYPSMAFDLMDGIRLNLKRNGLTDFQLHTENIGFGENAEASYAAAEKLVLQHNVKLIIAYATSLNAETLYPFAGNSNIPILFIDAGMEIFEAPPHPLCRHITLQGLMACRLLGYRASEGGKKVLSASSFLDGGYRGSWAFQDAISKNGGMVSGHFVSHYLPAEFNIDQLEQLIRQTETQSVTAAFSSYLAGLFLDNVRLKGEAARSVNIFCSPFMADEQLLGNIPFPGGKLYTVVPWATSLDHEENRIFIETIRKEKNKTANIFHLLGWEAATAAHKAISENISALDGWSFESPRGTVHFHPETYNALAPLYEGRIEADENGNCALIITARVETAADDHRELHFTRLDGSYSRWRNNFFCI